jgi:hypothetical protein
MKLTKSQAELLKFIDWYTDRFFGTRVLPHVTLNAISDYKREYRR